MNLEETIEYAIEEGLFHCEACGKTVTDDDAPEGICQECLEN